MELDVEMTGNIPNLGVKLNNQEKMYRFHLDIGASITVIFSEIAQELNLTIDRNNKKIGKSAKGEVELPLTMLRSLKIGSEELFDLKVAISDMKEGKAHCIGGVSGVIGHDILKHYVVSLNYPKKTLKLIKSELTKLNGWSKFNYFDNTHMVSIEGIIENFEPYWFVLDTGAGGNVLAQSLAKKLNLPLRNFEGKALSASGFIDIQIATVSLFKTDFKELRNTSMLIMNLDHFDPLSEKKFGGILGYPFFKDSELIIDYPNQKVALIEIKDS